jgi:hypothetical protein
MIDSIDIAYLDMMRESRAAKGAVLKEEGEAPAGAMGSAENLPSPDSPEFAMSPYNVPSAAMGYILSRFAGSKDTIKSWRDSLKADTKRAKAIKKQLTCCPFEALDEAERMLEGDHGSED